MGKLICVLLACLGVCGMAKAQAMPDAPSQHRFWDTPNRILFFSHATLEATDFGITHHNLSQGGQETNPLGRRLCESGTLGQLVYFGGRTAGVAGISYLLHRTGHHRLERAFFLLASYDSASGLRYSLAH